MPTNQTTTCTGTQDLVTGNTTQICVAENTPQIFNGFSSGEIVISLLLYLNLMVAISIGYMLRFRRVKIKNQ
ncbi:MAG: hypothetical protein ACRENK_11815 [Gemmatimonadaceae bacterium]